MSTTKTTACNVAALAIALIFTSCAGEELEKIAHLNGSPEKTLVEVTTFNEEMPAEVSVPSVAEYKFTNEDDNNVIVFRGVNCTINSITVDYSKPAGNQRTVVVTATGTSEKFAKAENGSNQVIARTSYIQHVPVAPVQEDVYTYEVSKTENSSDTQLRTSYEVNRYLNGDLDQTWKFSVANFEYKAYTGSANLYTAADPKWIASISLLEGNAMNSIGEEIKVDHGTSVEEKNVSAKIWKNGEYVSTDKESVTMTVTNRYFYGDFTFISTADKRISCDGSYLMKTASNVVFTDSLTGHQEILVGTAVGTVEMTETSYVQNPEAAQTITDCEGREYGYKGDYTISVEAKINGTTVCSSKTVMPTYALR